MDAEDGTTTTSASMVRRRRPRIRVPVDARSDTGARRRRPPGRVLGGRGVASGQRDASGRTVRPARGRRPDWRPGRDQLHLLGSLVDAGVRIDVALDTLAGPTSTPSTRRAASQVAGLVRDGGSVGAALAEVGAPTHVVALVSGGERTGRLGDALRGAGDLVGHIDRLHITVRRALLYPGLILAIGVAMTAVIAVAVIPPLERTFVDLGGELPLVTRLVIAGGSALRGPWGPGLLVGTVVLGRLVPLVGPLRRVARAMRGRMPVVRAVDADLDVAVLATLLTTMVRGGVPLLDALVTCRGVMRPGRRREAVDRAVTSVRSGGPAFDADGLGCVLSATEREIVAVAERGGPLADQLERVAALRRERLEERVARLGSTLEPLLVLVVGLVVGSVVLALYLPTFRVLELL